MLDQLINLVVITSYFYVAMLFITWLINKEHLQSVQEEIVWQDTCLQWQQHKQYWQQGDGSYYDLLASFVPKNDKWTMNQDGILEIGNGGLKRTV